MIVLLLPLLVGLVLLATMVVAARWFGNANANDLARKVRAGGNLGLVLVGLLLVLRGQVLLGFSLMAAGFGRLRGGAGSSPFGGASPFGQGSPFARGSFGRGSAFGGTSPFGPWRRTSAGRRAAGQRSKVRTATLDAELDHDTGGMDATVRAGRFEGRRLSAMTRADVVALHTQCATAGEEDSRLLLEAYLDRRHPEWRDYVEDDRHAGAGGAGRAGGPNPGAMTEDDAYQVLGLRPGAGEAEIRAAHRRLMKQMHPDQGGSTFLAAQLNEAKDVLLGRR